MELMTMESPIRTDGTKTPLRRPEEKRRERSVSRTSDHSSIPDTNDEQLQREEALHNKALTTDDLQTILRNERHRNKRRTEHLQATVDHVQDNLQEAIYDIETQSRIGAHLVYERLQEDAKQASRSFTVEGSPKEATPADKHAFIKWILEASECNDPDCKASLTNTRGEVSNTILLTFSSGWHRNKTFQWYTDQYSRRKQQLWWWSQATGRQTHNHIRIRKTLSEDARIRGRYLKAAMACGDNSQQRIDIYPVWGENAIKETSTGEYLVWCHFYYPNATCQVFIHSSVFDLIHRFMEAKIEDLYSTAGGKGKGRQSRPPNKGRGKGAFSSLDTPFDPRDPYFGWSLSKLPAALQARSKFEMAEG